MLQLVIPEQEIWDESSEMFIKTKGHVLCLEHSLVSLSKWEAKWHKPFLSTFATSFPYDETIDYIKFMTITQNVDPSVYEFLTKNDIEKVNSYIEEPMTATKIREPKGRGGKEIITSELIYYWMIALNIPFECQRWHLNRLLTLIRVCSIKNEPPKKRSAREILAENNALNMARRKQLNTTG